MNPCALVGSRGTLEQFLHALDVTLQIDGSTVPNANSYFGQIAQGVFGGVSGLGTEWDYDTGITLQNPGDQIVVYSSWVLDRRIRVTGSLPRAVASSSQA